MITPNVGKRFEDCKEIRAMSCEQHSFNVLPDKYVRPEMPNNLDSVADERTSVPSKSFSDSRNTEIWQGKPKVIMFGRSIPVSITV